jgi:hypothetical protein
MLRDSLISPQVAKLIPLVVEANPLGEAELNGIISVYAPNNNVLSTLVPDLMNSINSSNPFVTFNHLISAMVCDGQLTFGYPPLSTAVSPFDFAGAILLNMLASPKVLSDICIYRIENYIVYTISIMIGKILPGVAVEDVAVDVRLLDGFFEDDYNALHNVYRWPRPISDFVKNMYKYNDNVLNVQFDDDKKQTYPDRNNLEFADIPAKMSDFTPNRRSVLHGYSMGRQFRKIDDVVNRFFTYDDMNAFLESLSRESVGNYRKYAILIRLFTIFIISTRGQKVIDIFAAADTVIRPTSYNFLLYPYRGRPDVTSPSTIIQHVGRFGSWISMLMKMDAIEHVEWIGVDPNIYLGSLGARNFASVFYAYYGVLDSFLNESKMTLKPEKKISYVLESCDDDGILYRLMNMLGKGGQFVSLAEDIKTENVIGHIRAQGLSDLVTEISDILKSNAPQYGFVTDIKYVADAKLDKLPDTPFYTFIPADEKKTDIAPLDLDKLNQYTFFPAYNAAVKEAEEKRSWFLIKNYKNYFGFSDPKSYRNMDYRERLNELPFKFNNIDLGKLLITDLIYTEEMNAYLFTDASVERTRDGHSALVAPKLYPDRSITSSVSILNLYTSIDNIATVLTCDVAQSVKKRFSITNLPLMELFTTM